MLSIAVWRPQGASPVLVEKGTDNSWSFGSMFDVLTKRYGKQEDTQNANINGNDVFIDLFVGYSFYARYSKVKNNNGNNNAFVNHDS